VQEQDLLTGDDDSERKARLAESRDAQGLVCGIISAILVIGSLPMMTGLHSRSSRCGCITLASGSIDCTSSVLVWQVLLREQLEL